MKLKFVVLSILLILFSILKAQNEFVTIWKPSNTGFPPSLSTSLYSNFTFQVQEPIITTVLNVPLLIDFGTPFNTIANNATYILKVSYKT